MIFLGTESWVSFMKERTENLRSTANVLAVDLNPSLAFSMRLNAALEIYPSVDWLYITSTSSREKLEENSQLYCLLRNDNVKLVRGHRQSLLQLLLSDFNPRSSGG